MCGLYFDPKAMAFLKLHLAFSRQFRDDRLSIQLLVFILYYSGVFPLLQTEFLPKVFKMLSHQLLEFRVSWPITVSSATRKQVNLKMILNVPG